MHNTNDYNNNTNDDKIRSKISNIRMILSRLGNTVTNTDRKKVRRKLYEKEKKENLSDKEKEKIYDLVELVNTLNKKEEYKYHDRDDLDYYGIGDMLMIMIITSQYQSKVLLKITINIMKAEDIKTKNYW